MAGWRRRVVRGDRAVAARGRRGAGRPGLGHLPEQAAPCPARRGAQPAMTRFLTALGNEVRKGLLFAWSERLQIALELPFFTVFILLLGPMLGAGRQIAAGHLSWTLSSSRISPLMIAFVPATFSYLQAVKLFWRLLREIQSGTTAERYLSPLPSGPV